VVLLESYVRGTLGVMLATVIIIIIIIIMYRGFGTYILGGHLQ
jgi:hypothetical protein